MQTLKLTKKYEKYPEYKDSGVEWLGKIPTDWDKRKLKFVSSITPGFAFCSEDYTDQGAMLVRITDVKSVIEENSKKYLPIEFYERYKTFRVNCGDLLISMTGYVGETSLFPLKEPALLNQRVGKIMANSEICSKYVYYLTKHNLFKVFLSFQSKSSAQENVSDKDIGAYFLALPCRHDQEKIAKYLDEKIFLIDQIISKKQRLGNFLHEKRTSVINNAVTKGLSPKIQLVEGGVEWIGKIPKGWKIKRLKDISSYCSRGGTPDYIESEDGYKFINQSCVRDGYFDLDKIKFSKTESKKGLVRKGDILINSTGTGTLGRLAVFNENNTYFADTHVTIYRPEKAYSRFVMYLIQHPAWQNYLYASSVSGSTNQIELSRSKFLEIPVLIPSNDEQINIADYLDKKVSIFEKAIKDIERSVELLQEFKSSLISSVVTGKIKI